MRVGLKLEGEPSTLSMMRKRRFRTARIGANMEWLAADDWSWCSHAQAQGMAPSIPRNLPG